jgi:Cu+-exporting ATPase
MRWILVVAIALVGCQKEAAESAPTKKPPAPVTAGTVAADGVRTVQVEAGKDGYVPDRIAGKPGEKLKLVFTRTIDSECLAEVKAPDGKKYALPMHKGVEVAVTVPTDGEVAFACGMDMVHGVIVADKSKS